MLRSIFLALLIAVGVGAWLASGKYSEKPVEPVVEKPAAKLERQEKLRRVRTRILSAENFTSELKLSATTQSKAKITVSSEQTGRVSEVTFSKGDTVEEGDLLAVIEADGRDIDQSQAQAQLKQAKAELDSGRKLANRGFLAKNRLRSLEAAYEAARAGVARADNQLDNLEIRALASGIVQDKLVEIGQFVSIGTPVATLVDATAVKLTTQVSEQDIEKISVGSLAMATTITGSELEGAVTFISNVANPATRTFDVEVTAPNTTGRSLEGMTTEIVFPLQSRNAHRVPASLLSLDKQGAIGIKLVSADSMVEFIPIELVNATQDGVWLDGLPSKIELIVVGQEFVQEGQRVEAVDENDVAEQVEADEKALEASSSENTAAKPTTVAAEEG